MKKFSDAVYYPDLAVAGHRGCALARDRLAVGMPGLPVPVLNASFCRRPNIFTIESEVAIDVPGLSVRKLHGSPSVSIPSAQPGMAPGKYPDCPFRGDSNLLGRTGRRRYLLPAVLGLAKDRIGESGPVPRPHY